MIEKPEKKDRILNISSKFNLSRLISLFPLDSPGLEKGKSSKQKQVKGEKLACFAKFLREGRSDLKP